MPRRFTTPIELPGNPTGPLEAAPRQYIDAADALKADDAAVVHKTGAETVQGLKTFVNGVATAQPSAANMAVRNDDVRFVPSGGTSGQVLSKASNSNYDMAWTTPSGGGSGSQTVNYYQPLVNETFSATAGSSQTFTLANTNYGIQLVFINGQALQASEYSSTSTQLTVTPVDGPLVTGDAVVAVYAKANVFSGTYADDIEITNAAKGVILRDRVNGERYRLFMSGGVLGTEAVT